MEMQMQRWQKVCLGILGAVLAYWILLHILFQPSLDRDWNKDQEILPTATINGEIVIIENVRNFSYENTTSYNESWINVTLNLSQMKSAWFMVERFDAFDGLAHTLVSFEFSDGQYIAVSAEIRKEKGESYSPTKGLLRQYELMYVIATEEDVIKLRTNYRKDPVWLYPIKTTPEKAQQVFTNMLLRANGLAEKPEFYNTLTNTCTTNIREHVNDVSTVVPRSWKILLPGYVDELVFDIGIIDTEAKTIEEAREEFFITTKAQESDGEESFSKAIRQ